VGFGGGGERERGLWGGVGPWSGGMKQVKQTKGAGIIVLNPIEMIC